MNRGAKEDIIMLKKSLLGMNLQLFSADNGGGDGGNPANPSQPTEITIDAFKQFAETNEDARKFLESNTQSQVDKAIESWKANNLDNVIQDAIKKHEETKSTKTPEQIRIEKLEQQVQENENRRILAENQALVSNEIANLSVDDALKEDVSNVMMSLCVSKDAEQTKANVDVLTKLLGKINELHQDQLTKQEFKKAFGNENQESNKNNQPPSGDPMKDLENQMSKFI